MISFNSQKCVVTITSRVSLYRELKISTFECFKVPNFKQIGKAGKKLRGLLEVNLQSVKCEQREQLQLIR